MKLFKFLIFFSTLLFCLSSQQLLQSNEIKQQPKKLSNKQKQTEILKKLSDINKKIEYVRKLKALTSRSKLYTKQQNQKTQKFISKFKIRKYQQYLINIQHLLPSQQSVQNSQSLLTLKHHIISSILPTPNIGIPSSSKKYQGINIYSYIMINLYNQIYSFQGQKLISLEINQKKQNFTLNEIKNNNLISLSKLMPIPIRMLILPLISTHNNQHVYFAYYVDKIVNNKQKQVGYHKQEKRQTQLRIQKLQLQKKHLVFKNPSSYHIQKIKPKNQQPNNQNQEQEQQINNNYISILKKQQDQFYNYFFYYQPIGPLSQKRNYLIFCSQNRIDFYFQINNNNNENYSNRKRHNKNKNNLILDNKRSINLKNMNKINNQQQNKIISIVRSHNFLIVLLQNKKVLVINLQRYLNPKLTNSLNRHIIVHSTINNNYQRLLKLHIIQSQQKYFYIQGQTNIYKFQIYESESSLINQVVSQIKLVRKYVLIDTSNCQFNTIYEKNYKCTKQIHVLQDYIIVQRRIIKIISNNRNRQDLIQHYLIEKTTDKIISYNLPFSHISYCQQQPNLIKFTLTKNKNTNYIISLICIIQQNKHQNNPSSPNSNKILIQHLSLQTSTISLTSSSSSSNLPSDAIDFSKFRLPLIALSIGLIFYITIKRSGNNKQKYDEEQNNKEISKHQELEQEIMKRIIKEKQRKKQLEEKMKNIEQMNKMKKNM